MAEDVSYAPVDAGQNSNGKDIIQICKDNNMLVINNLKYKSKVFKGSLTFRKKEKWISELDVCIASHGIASNIVEFTVNNSLQFPSDHAALSVILDFPESMMSAQCLLQKALNLDSHAILNTSADEKCKQPVSMERLDCESFISELNQHALPTIDHSISTDEVAGNVTDILYLCASKSKKAFSKQVTMNQITNGTITPRWNRVLDCDDPKMLWKAIDWRGNLAL